ncbi:MAG: cyclic nucleotide-binding domain-containing protein [Myxococcota bacterium]|nr:cyclic nucleotide-binding domain-containing protein [Myxococcota bacterium]
MKGAREALEQHPLLGGLGEETRELLLERGELRDLIPAEAIAREGRPADACFLLLEGQARVTRSTPKGAQLELARLNPGSLFGLVGLRDDTLRPATYAAIGPSQVLEIPADVLDAAPRSPQARHALAIREVLALALQTQLRVANQHLIHRAAAVRAELEEIPVPEPDAWEAHTYGGWKPPRPPPGSGPSED